VCSSDLAGAGHVAVFDLDGCLFDTRQRQVHIFRELASRQDLWPLYRVAEEHFVDWDLAHTMRRAGIADEWIEAHLDEVREGWKQRFFDGDYTVVDHAMPGSARLVREVWDAGCTVVYLTGRDERMRPGTDLSLRRSGFPMGERTVLVMKPTFEMDDTAFKEGALEGISAMGRVILYLDNEPANVNMYLRTHPDALVVFIESDHSPRPIEPNPEIPWLRCFLPAPI
jgi:hypothetical protein